MERYFDLHRPLTIKNLDTGRVIEIKWVEKNGQFIEKTKVINEGKPTGRKK